MLLALVAVVELASAPSGLKVAFPGLTGVGVPQEKLAFFTDHLDQHMTFAGADTVTSREIAALLGVERQKQLLGCSDDSSSCMAELAGALNADAMLVGDVTRLDSGGFTVNLKLLRSDGRSLSAFSDRVSGEDELTDSLATGAKELVTQGAAALGRTVTPTAVRTVSPLRKWSVLPAIIGLGGVVTGAAFLIQARLAYDALKPSTAISTSQASKYVTDGERSQLIGLIATGVGLAALAGAAGMFFAGRDQTISTSVAPVPGGAAISIGGSW